MKFIPQTLKKFLSNQKNFRTLQKYENTIQKLI